MNTQTWVNILAHEGIWLNAGAKFDINNDTNHPIGEIANGSENSFSPYTVAPSSRTAIRSAFGF